MSTIERDIEETRAHLGDTVDALSAKAAAGKRKAGAIALLCVAALAALLVWRRFG